MNPTAGTVLAGKYRLDRPLARGGMGAVWVGYHLALDIPVAVKFMHPGVSDADLARTRFAREAKASAALRSPHVVQIIDYDAVGDTPYIVMELLEGEDLGKRLAQRGRLSLAEVARIVKQLAAGLGIAHDAGIVHRDLKPSNVFLTTIGGEEVVKILDFGVAKETRIEGSDTQTNTGVVVGSPSYMSPEQARAGEIDGRSDLWSVGVLVFQALTGRRPFEGTNLGDTLVKICSDPLPVASLVAEGLPPAVDAFFDRALCRSPDGRFQDARALADALGAIAAGSPEHVVTGALVPRADATGSVAAHREPTRETAVQPAPRAEPTATVKARSINVSPTIEVQRMEPPGPDVTTGGAASVTALPPAKASDRRGILWALGGAALVAGIWGASRVGVFTGASADPRAALATSPSSSETATAAPSQTAAPALSASTNAEPSSSASSPVVAASSAPAPSVVVPARPRAFVPGAAPRPRAGGSVDPKFGLPVP